MADTRVLFAVGDEGEGRRFAAEIAGSTQGFSWSFLKSLPEVEARFSSGSADAIVTDFHFHSGAFVDWLTLWPLPALILTDPGDDMIRIERAIADESSFFLERDSEGRYLAKIPVVLRKVLHVRDSIQRQNAHVQLTERQYLNLLQAVPDVVYMLDEKGNFIYLNNSIRNLGFDPTKLIGRHFSEIVHPEDIPRVSRDCVIQRAARRDCEEASGDERPGDERPGAERPGLGHPGGEHSDEKPASPKIFDERRGGNRMTRNLELRLRRGHIDDPIYATVNAYGEVSATGFVLPEHEGRDLGTVGIIRDITERWQYEKNLEEAIRSGQVLLKEIHHRVKNNLQIISSLLNMQGHSIEDEASKGILLECQNQIQSMAMVHEILYSAGNFEGLDMAAYFARLFEHLVPLYKRSQGGITQHIETTDMILPLDSAIPVALIVNELVSNSLKHAFPDGRQGRIELRMRSEGGVWILEVADDGIGFAAARGIAGKRRGIGMDLVQALCAQLRAELIMSDSGGAHTLIRIPTTSA